MFVDAATGLSFGFGIGEESTGENSAGVAFATQAGLPASVPFVGPAAAGARAADQTITGILSPAVSGGPASLTGSFHAIYDAATGTITVGVGAAGDNTPASVAVFAASDVSDRWTGALLLVSFFIRSDIISVPIFGTVSTEWTLGEATVTFTDFRVLNGAAFDVACFADFNRDGTPNTLDIAQFIDAAIADTPDADLNGDGSSNALDLLVLLRQLDEGC